MKKLKSPYFENFKSFILSEPSMEIDYLESCFYEDLENKKIKWMVFGHKVCPTSDADMCHDQMGQMYYDAKETNGNSYIREYSHKFKAVRYSRNQHLNTMPKSVKPMKPSKYIKLLILKLKKDCYNAVFDIHMLSGGELEVKAIRTAYKRSMSELEAFIIDSKQHKPKINASLTIPN